MDDPELAALQVAMIQSLTTSSSSDGARAALLAAGLSEETKAWIRGWDPRSVEVAMAILAGWEIRAGG
ncbi:MAG: hypothetical protein JNL21_14670 [Myxococcales bacterium]|nr:hypothetical protein [Myxococcales bacterium]